MTKRRTQAERREETRGRMLKEARRLFGEKGYADTSLDDIAEACGVTVRPVYHYFENKLGLFKAVIEEIEAEMVANIQGRESASLIDVWTGFMKNCEDPHFRQIILIDGPTLIGRRRMMDGPINQAARRRTAEVMGRAADGLTMSMVMGALSSAALYIADQGASPEDYDKVRNLIEYFARPNTSGGKDKHAD